MIDMSIIDENEIDVVALQKELNKLREENQNLRQEKKIFLSFQTCILLLKKTKIFDRRMQV